MILYFVRKPNYVPTLLYSWQSHNELMCTPPRKKARLTAEDEDVEGSPSDEGYVSRASFEETPNTDGKRKST